MTPLRSAAFRWLWCASFTSSGAQWMERTATAWLTLEAGGSAFAVGLVLAARMFPSLLFGLAAGTMADRIDRRYQLIAVAVGAAALMAGLGGLVGSGTIEVWHVVVISFATGCVQVFDMPARQALVLDTVPRSAATNAMALNAFAMRLAGAVGAFAAGLLIPLIGVAQCYLVIAAVYGSTALLVTRLHAPQTSRAAASHPPFGQALREAANLIVDVRAVRTLILAGIAAEIFAFSHSSALPVFAQNVLDAGPTGLGTLNAAVSVGGMLGVGLLSLLPGRVPREPLLGATFVLYGISLMGVGLVHNLALAAAVLVITGICVATFDVLQQTLLQMAVPEEQRGRAVGIWVLSLGAGPVGHLETGMLMTVLGAPGALLINGALTVTAAATLLARAPGYRWARPVRPAVRRG